LAKNKKGRIKNIIKENERRNKVVIEEKLFEFFSRFPTQKHVIESGGLLDLILDNQEKLKGKKITYEKMSPYYFQLSSTFNKIVLKGNKLQLIINWNNKKKIGAEFDVNSLNILIDEKKGITFQDTGRYGERKINILLKES